MKLFNKSGNNKGFTLIEMVIVLAVLGIILTFITAIFVQIMRVETEIADIAQVEIIAAEATVELIDDLRFAKGIDIISESEVKITTDDYVATYTIDATNGILMREYENDDPPGAYPVHAQGFYMGTTMSFTCKEEGTVAGSDYTITLDVTFYEDGTDEIYSEQYVIRPTLINANG